MSSYSDKRGTPPGILLLRNLRGGSIRDGEWRLSSYRYTILLVTFISYTCYHASRKPTSIVKSVLCPSHNSYPWPKGEAFVKENVVADEVGESRNNGWAPFNEPDGTSKLGEIDVAFLACYSLGVYVAGHLGDTLDLRLFLTTGMVGSGAFVALFGMGYFWNVHMFWFYLLTQMAGGLFQATGWPSVVAVIGNWFGKSKRGLIMGIWNAHTSVGNISGSLLAASVLEFGWGWSFVIPGALIAFGGIIVYLFLAAYPEDVGFTYPEGAASDLKPVYDDEEAQVQKGNTQEEGEEGEEGEEERTPMSRKGSVSRKSIGPLEACLIPGVIPYALCLFFSKLVAYTILYWLPFYLSQTEIDGEYVSVKSAGNLSTLFDVGGIFGGILAGYISDKFNARATTAASFMYTAIPAMLLFRVYGSISNTLNIFLMVATGIFVNGPYALITTAVSADLGTHSCLKGDSRAVATVTAIIDGTGSVGAALGPFLTGFISTKGWNAVFTMLVIGALIAGLLLTRLVIAEVMEKTQRPPSSTGGTQNIGGSSSQPLMEDQR